MGKTTLKETAILAGFTHIVEHFLPVTAGIGNDKEHSFYAAAKGAKVLKYWLAGVNKRAAITHLIAFVYEHKREKFIPLLKEILHRGIKHRNNLRDSINNEEIDALIKQADKLGFSDEELSDLKNYFSATSDKSSIKKQLSENSSRLRKEYYRIKACQPQKRGYEFQKFFYKLLYISQYAPNGPYRYNGAEMDGSFQVEGHHFLLEIKWHTKLTSHNDVMAFEGKIDRGLKNTMGLFFSHSGFTNECLATIERGKSACTIGMDGKDLLLILDEKITMTEAIRLKLRKASETNRFFAPLDNLLK